MDPATLSLILNAAPLAINALTSVFGGGSKAPQPLQPIQMPTMDAPMTWQQALAQTQGQLAPLLRQYDNDAMQRGFYGQLPTDVARSDYAAAAQAQLANQAMQQDWSQKFAQFQQNADMALKQGSLNLGQNQLWQQGQQNQWNKNMGASQMGNDWFYNYSNVFGHAPFSEQQTTAFAQKNIEMMKNALNEAGYDLVLRQNPTGGM